MYHTTVRLVLSLLVFILSFQLSKATTPAYNILVSKEAGSQYQSIQKAIESLPMYCYDRVIIFVKNGIYNEKIKIDRDYVTLVGESTDSTIIRFSQLRSDWDANPDAIGPAVVNIFADDVILKNLTIENTQPEIGPHAFAVYGTGTRTILKNCKAISKGGDTVSLWNYKEGMYYHDSCYFEGAVDFVCPRGWCYISNSTFCEVKNTAAIWHAAPTNKDQRFVLSDCNFTGLDSFYLARHHYDAQFYFVNCSFGSYLCNKAPEHVWDAAHPENNRPYLYGDRYYFFNCSRSAGNYEWFADNLQNWPKRVTPDTITPAWTFDQAWNPTDTSSLKIIKTEINDSSLYLWFPELVMTVGKVTLQFASGKKATYIIGSGRDRLEFKATSPLNDDDLKSTFKIISGQIQNIKATVIERMLVQKTD
jgi:pectinesterase